MFAKLIRLIIRGKMGLHMNDWMVLLGCFVFVTLIGWWSRKLIKTQGDFIVGGRSGDTV